MAGLREIGVKMREWHFRELSSWISKRGRAMSRLPPNQESAPLVYIFALPAMNGPFPADLNSRENTVYAGILVSQQNKKWHKMYSLSVKYLKKNSIQNTITVLFILTVIFSFLDKTCYKSQG